MAAIAEWALQVDPYCYFSETETWLSGATLETATPVDLTGYVAALMIRCCATSPVIISVSTTGNAQGSIVLGGSAGTIQINLMPAATTLLVGIDQAEYDLILTSASGLPIKVMSGDVLVSQTITHS
jgi:hypothetical protein